ncbi:ArsI/CadI family heavy metal resistance metalloenzyme [Micromonospora sp. WMMA1998]|uniref:ArsI/CadI family heavy metal resistance metalloenzyme n=1 Tax=Micromonospora sp. WMMA1998 TaxID=3015167 RepID=UPI0032B11AD8
MHLPHHVEGLPGGVGELPVLVPFPREPPPLKLVLLKGEPGRPTVLDHLGVEVASTDEVAAAIGRLTDAGPVTLEENDTECCYALQDKVWVRGPGDEPWEVYTVKADSPQLAKAAESTCCA